MDEIFQSLNHLKYDSVFVGVDPRLEVAWFRPELESRKRGRYCTELELLGHLKMSLGA